MKDLQKIRLYKAITDFEVFDRAMMHRQDLRLDEDTNIEFQESQVLITLGQAVVNLSSNSFRHLLAEIKEQRESDIKFAKALELKAAARKRKLELTPIGPDLFKAEDEYIEYMGHACQVASASNICVTQIRKILYIYKHGGQVIIREKTYANMDELIEVLSNLTGIDDIKEFCGRDLI